jgi:hypothetical protein
MCGTDADAHIRERAHIHKPSVTHGRHHSHRRGRFPHVCYNNERRPPVLGIQLLGPAGHREHCGSGQTQGGGFGVRLHLINLNHYSPGALRVVSVKVRCTSQKERARERGERERESSECMWVFTSSRSVVCIF